jgi:hypothetical protein
MDKEREEARRTAGFPFPSHISVVDAANRLKKEEFDQK